jgi:hypothetical protein
MQLVARDRPACYHYIQVACNSRPNGQQPNVAHSRTHSSKRLKRRRQHGLASNVSFQPTFFGLSPRRRRRERCPHTTRPRSRSGRPMGPVIDARFPPPSCFFEKPQFSACAATTSFRARAPMPKKPRARPSLADRFCEAIKELTAERQLAPARHAFKPARTNRSQPSRAPIPEPARPCRCRSTTT